MSWILSLDHRVSNGVFNTDYLKVNSFRMHDNIGTMFLNIRDLNYVFSYIDPKEMTEKNIIFTGELPLDFTKQDFSLRWIFSNEDFKNETHSLSVSASDFTKNLYRQLIAAANHFIKSEKDKAVCEKHRTYQNLIQQFFNLKTKK